MTTPEVTEVPGRDISKLMAPGTEKRQGMRGFDADYVDIVDYIVRCTHKIWEEKQVGLIYTHYGYNALGPWDARGLLRHRVGRGRHGADARHVPRPPALRRRRDLERR